MIDYEDDKSTGTTHNNNQLSGMITDETWKLKNI